MSVYTTVSPEQLALWLQRYTLGSLVELKGIAAGVTNTNYFVTTTQGRYVLTVFEALHLHELPFYLELMHHLSHHGVALPQPIADQSGQFASLLCDKPACLVSCLTGQDVEHPSIAQCQNVASGLAYMHLAGKSFPQTMDNPRGRTWFHDTAQRVIPFLSPAETELLTDELAAQQHLPQDLPCGIIHADLFRDNVLFDGEKLSGFIDFYYACHDAWLYDLAITINDWCLQPSGNLDPTRARAMLQAYQSVRPLELGEHLAWPLMLRAAALRFWLSRLLDFHLPTAGEMTFTKDPVVFQRILEAHRSRKNFWLDEF